MELLFQDDRVIVCLKSPGVCSTDVPGGMPELIRQQLGDPTAVVRTVHRLDQVVGGVMVFARTARAAGDLSAQIRDHQFEKVYLAVCHGVPPKEGSMEDLLYRNRAQRKTYFASAPGKDVQSAVLRYRTLAQGAGLALVEVALQTGRTHQIRAQFAGHGFPLAGDKKYGTEDSLSQVALWSHRISFLHPRSGQRMSFSAMPPAAPPWTLFSDALDGIRPSSPGK